MTLYLLDSTVLIDHLRDLPRVADFLLRAEEEGHSFGTTCVNVAEVERGLKPKEREATDALFDHLIYLVTTERAAKHAGAYQREMARRGRTLHTADALIAGTAREYDAVIVTDNVRDFPVRGVEVIRPD